MGSLLEVSWALFGVFAGGFVRRVKKCSFGLFLGAKSRGPLLQKHAIRTVHPSKIGDQLSIVYVLLHVSQRPPFWSPKACLGASNQTPTSMFFGTWYKVFILPRLGVPWRSNLDHFRHASWGYPAAEMCFFLVPGSVRVIFRSQVVSGPDYGRYLEPLWGVVS